MANLPGGTIVGGGGGGGLSTEDQIVIDSIKALPDGTIPQIVGGSLVDGHFSYDDSTEVMEVDSTFRATVNSFQLGNMHSITSGHKNIYFKDLSDLTSYSSLLEGILQYDPNNSGNPLIITPFHRDYSNLGVPIPRTNGSSTAHSTITAPYGEIIASLEADIVVLSLTIAFAEVYTGRIYYTIREGSQTGRLVYRQFVDVDITQANVDAGDTFTFVFDSPSEHQLGQTIALDLLKPDGSALTLRADSINTDKVWKSAAVMLFNYEPIVSNHPVYHSADGAYTILPKDNSREFHIETADLITINGDFLFGGMFFTVINTSGTDRNVAFTGFAGVFERVGEDPVSLGTVGNYLCKKNTSTRFTVTDIADSKFLNIAPGSSFDALDLINLSESVVFDSAMVDGSLTTQVLGGYPIGTDVAELKNLPLTTLLENAMFPSVSAYIGTPSSITMDSFLTLQVMEVGLLFNPTVTITFNQGRVTNGDESEGQVISLGMQSYLLLNPLGADSIRNNETGNINSSGPQTVLAYNLLRGSNAWALSATCSPGGTPSYMTNKGVHASTSPVEEIDLALLRTTPLKSSTYTINAANARFQFLGARGGFPEASADIRALGVDLLSVFNTADFTVNVPTGTSEYVIYVPVGLTVVIQNPATNETFELVVVPYNIDNAGGVSTPYEAHFLDLGLNGFPQDATFNVVIT